MPLGECYMVEGVQEESLKEGGVCVVRDETSAGWSVLCPSV